MEQFEVNGGLRSSSENGAMAAANQNLVGTRVRKLRTVANLSQEALSARCQAVGWDISRGTFAKIESGLRRVNDAEVVILAKALRCEVSALLEGVTVSKAVAVARQGDSES
jgi:transcriptional regulator with XRE-family HTH domain